MKTIAFARNPSAEDWHSLPYVGQAGSLTIHDPDPLVIARCIIR